MAKKKSKTCFIIMPITTPVRTLSNYADDKDHFKHVLEELFIPAVEKAGFTPIPPITKGAEVIQASIISNLEKADLVLCDISILNPNVFFELGIRTALNKPICILRDDNIDKIPFDTSIINAYQYQSKLFSWGVRKDIDEIASHIRESYDENNIANSLWSYFGISTIAAPYVTKEGDNTDIDYLKLQLNEIKHQIFNSNIGKVEPLLSKEESKRPLTLLELDEIVRSFIDVPMGFERKENSLVIHLEKAKSIPVAIKKQIINNIMTRGQYDEVYIFGEPKLVAGKL